MDHEIEDRWNRVLEYLSVTFHEEVDMKGALFLIGVQELGSGAKSFSKDDKLDLMHIAICRLLSKWGYYELKGQDNDGWPIWEATGKLPFLKPGEQTRLLMQATVEYFEEHDLVNKPT